MVDRNDTIVQGDSLIKGDNDKLLVVSNQVDIGEWTDGRLTYIGVATRVDFGMIIGGN